MDRVVIIGAGQAGWQAASTLRSEGFDGDVTILGDEPYPPYQRPPLSKGLLSGTIEFDRTLFSKPDFYAQKRIELRTSTTVTSIDRTARSVGLADGSSLPYDKLLLATGSRLRRLAVPGADRATLRYLKTIDDALAIRGELGEGRRVVVIGGGYIGLEAAATAIKAGGKVTVLEAASRVMARTASLPLSRFFEDRHRDHGVDLRIGAQIEAIEEGPAGTIVLGDGERIEADLIIVGVGSLAEDELARASGLECSNGIVVDEYARTADPSVFAAGDVTFHYDPISGTSRRLECVQNALRQAQTAARAMLGRMTPHVDLPTFWSDQYDLKLQIAGLPDPVNAVVLRGQIEDGRFSVLHVREGRLTALETVNVPKDFMQARKFIAEATPIDAGIAADFGQPLTAAFATAATG